MNEFSQLGLLRHPFFWIWPHWGRKYNVSGNSPTQMCPYVLGCDECDADAGSHLAFHRCIAHRLQSRGLEDCLWAYQFRGGWVAGVLIVCKPEEIKQFTNSSVLQTCSLSSCLRNDVNACVFLFAQTGFARFIHALHRLRQCANYKIWSRIVQKKAHDTTYLRNHDTKNSLVKHLEEYLYLPDWEHADFLKEGLSKTKRY